MTIFEILIKGYILLAGAIVFNYWLGIFKIRNWYYLLNNFKNPRLRTIDFIFLFLISITVFAV